MRYQAIVAATPTCRKAWKGIGRIGETGNGNRRHRR
jgi:hypothetical protein